MADDLFPIVSTVDLDASLRFYRDLLGGTVSYEFPGPDGRIAYAGLDIGRSHIGLGHDPGAAARAGSVDLWVYVDDCDATVERLRAAGVPVLEEPLDQPWGERVALVEDPNGIRVRVGTRAPGV
ncbi:MAG TPA: VOC family protein [Clostridia bacterium]|nr:VOC family protein [Clostridia bacterium]